MNVPTAHPVSVPVERDVHGTVVLAAAFADVLRAFLSSGPVVVAG